MATLTSVLVLQLQLRQKIKEKTAEVKDAEDNLRVADKEASGVAKATLGESGVFGAVSDDMRCVSVLKVRI